jgi:hypothetical protein
MLAKRGRNSKKTIIVNGLMIGLEGVLAGYDRVTGKAEYATSYAWGLTLKGGVLTGQGFYTSLRATANDVLEAPFQTKRDIQKAQAEEIEFGKKVNEPFKKVESITRLEGELETLKRLMFEGMVYLNDGLSNALPAGGRAFLLLRFLYTPPFFNTPRHPETPPSLTRGKDWIARLFGLVIRLTCCKLEI